MENNSYILKLGPTPDGQVLYFFGAQHSNNPANPQFAKLKDFWNEFLSTTQKSRTVFTEGIYKEALGTYEEVIQQRGEVGAAQWLAKQEGIEAVYLEPDDSEQRKVLGGMFDLDIVAYALIVQNLAAWFHHARQSSFTEAVERSVKREAKFTEIYGFTLNTSWFHDQHEKLFDGQPLEDENFLNRISDPRRDDTVVNKVIANRTKIRNDYILTKIRGALDSRENIFIVYGRGHLTALEPKLRALFVHISPD